MRVDPRIFDSSASEAMQDDERRTNRAAFDVGDNAGAESSLRRVVLRQANVLSIAQAQSDDG
jgi:hypothetical protein